MNADIVLLRPLSRALRKSLYITFAHKKQIERVDALELISL